MPIKEFYLNRVLEELELSQDEFIDLCILLGCDYCEKIKGMGPKTSYDMIKKYRCIENVLTKIDKTKIPDDWLFKEARELFKSPEVANSDTLEIKWTDPDEEGLIKFLCEQNGFSEDRVKNGVKKLMKKREGSTQVRLDTFFTVTSKMNPAKRKAEENANSKKTKASRGKGQYKRGK